LPTLALLVSLLAAWLVAPLAWAIVVPVWLCLMALQMRFHARCKPWERSVFTLQRILLVHGRLAALDSPFTAALREGARAAGVLNRQITPLRWIKMIPLLSEYDDWLMLGNIRRYFHSLRVVRRERAFLRQSFLLLADLEADLALARHLRARAQFCWAQEADVRQLSLDAMVHPLLDGAMPLSLRLDGRGAFISGQNAIGKSTLLRGVGLNLVSARAFGFCYARAARVPMLPLYSSMQNEDSLDGGESLYIAELRRARELLALAEGGNATLSAARHELAAQGGALQQARTLPNPELQTVLEDTRRATRSTTVQLNQLIELGGKRAARTAVAQRGEDVAQAGLSLQQAETRAAVTSAFVDVLAAQEGLRLAAGKADLAADMLAMLLASLDADREAIKAARVANDQNALIERVHRLHGATRYCGVPQLRAACQRSETLLKQEDPKAATALDELERAINRLAAQAKIGA